MFNGREMCYIIMCGACLRIRRGARGCCRVVLAAKKHLVISKLVSNFATLLSAVDYAKTMSNPLGKRWLRCV